MRRMRAGLVVRRTWGLSIGQWTAIGALAALAAAVFAALQLLSTTQFASAAGTVPPDITEPTVIQAPDEAREGEITETEVANPESVGLECEYRLIDESGAVVFEDTFTIPPGEVVRLDVSVQAEGRYTRVVLCRRSARTDDLDEVVQRLPNAALLASARAPSACLERLGSELPRSLDVALARTCRAFSEEYRSAAGTLSASSDGVVELRSAMLRSLVDELRVNPPSLVLLEDSLTVTGP